MKRRHCWLRLRRHRTNGHFRDTSAHVLAECGGCGRWFVYATYWGGPK